MVPSFITALLFSCSIVFAYRSSQELGALKANFLRLLIGGFFLAIISHQFGVGLGGGALAYFVISGLIGFGFGDLAMFLALPKLGSRLTILLVQCLAAPIAAATEWLWLGIALSPFQMLAAFTILVGVALALSPAKHIRLKPKDFLVGVIWGTLAACGQGWGAVVSRKAYQVSHMAGSNVDGISAAFQRVLGGVVVAAIAWQCWPQSKIDEMNEGPVQRTGTRRLKSWHAVLLNALAGPVLGVSCYQWALSTTPSGIVLPIVALSPLAVIPFAYFLEGDKPTLKTIIGGITAVIGVIALSKT